MARYQTDPKISRAVAKLLKERDKPPRISPTGGTDGSHEHPKESHPDVLVASVNARAEVRRMADYVCDGVDDHEEIQAAVSEIGTYGRVRLSEGVFTFGAGVLLGEGVSLVGSGQGTILKPSGSYADNYLLRFTQAYGEAADFAVGGSWRPDGFDAVIYVEDYSTVHHIGVEDSFDITPVNGYRADCLALVYAAGDSSSVHHITVDHWSSYVESHLAGWTPTVQSEGSFDGNLDGWSLTDTTHLQDLVWDSGGDFPIDQQAGTAKVTVKATNNSSTGETQGISKTFTGLTVGREYRFVIWHTSPDAFNTTATPLFRTYVRGVTADSTYVTNVTDEWTAQLVEFTATATSHTVDLACSRTRSSTFDVYFDRWSLTYNWGSVSHRVANAPTVAVWVTSGSNLSVSDVSAVGCQSTVVMSNCTNSTVSNVRSAAAFTDVVLSASSDCEVSGVVADHEQNAHVGGYLVSRRVEVEPDGYVSGQADSACSVYVESSGSGRNVVRDVQLARRHCANGIVASAEGGDIYIEDVHVRDYGYSAVVALSTGDFAGSVKVRNLSYGPIGYDTPNNPQGWSSGYTAYDDYDDPSPWFQGPNGTYRHAAVVATELPTVVYGTESDKYKHHVLVDGVFKTEMGAANSTEAHIVYIHDTFSDASWMSDVRNVRDGALLDGTTSTYAIPVPIFDAGGQASVWPDEAVAVVGSSEPDARQVGELWVDDAADPPTLKYWDGNGWIALTGSAGDTLTRAGNVTVVFSGSAVPSPQGVGSATVVFDGSAAGAVVATSGVSAVTFAASGSVLLSGSASASASFALSGVGAVV